MTVPNEEDEYDDWHTHCLRDEARMSFVVPLLARTVIHLKSTFLVDIGSKTGTIVECLKTVMGIELPTMVVDQDPAALAFCRHRLGHAGHIQYHLGTAQDLRRKDFPETPGLMLIAYTLLEMPDDVVRQTLGFVARQDALLVVMPNCDEDLTEVDDQVALRYVGGEAITLHKSDWSGRNYPFIARSVRRLDEILGAVGLTETARYVYRTKADKVHIATLYRRVKRA